MFIFNCISWWSFFIFLSFNESLHREQHVYISLLPIFFALGDNNICIGLILEELSHDGVKLDILSGDYIS